MNIVIYTDGACSGNPGPGGWAAILKCEGQLKGKDAELVVGGNAKQTTNNRMELQAVLYALQSLQRPCNVTIFCDSAYVVNQAMGGWVQHWGENGWLTASNKPVKNQDLWQLLASEMKKHESVTFKKVQGHAGNEDNERADKEACRFRDMAKADNLVSFQKRYTVTNRGAK